MAATDIMTPEQVAEYLQVSSEIVYGCIDQGQLVAFRVGQQYRISRENLDLFLLSNATRQPHLRTYSEDDIQRFLDEDHLDSEGLEIAHNLLRALQPPT